MLRSLVALIAAAMLAGCLPVTSRSPVGTTAGLKADANLFGTWKGRNPDDTQQRDASFHFMRAKDGGIDIVVAMAEGGSDDGWTAFTARTAMLGANRFLNAVMTYDKAAPVEGGLKAANIPLLYIRNGRTMTLYLIDEDAAKAAIKAGRIAGTIGQGASGDAVITADARDLDAFMAKPEAATLFKRTLVLTKVE
jgi:hypothetical protein